MRRAAALLAMAALGFGAAWLTGTGPSEIIAYAAYPYVTAALLAVGLYGSAYGIDLIEARQDRRLILLAVTVGVLVKATLIGVVLALAWQDPLFLLLGIVVAQIDPLSVAAALGDGRMSGRARSLLAAWASFDDPLTVVLAVSAASVVGDLRGHPGDGLLAGLSAYAVELAANLALAAGAFVAYQWGPKKTWWRTGLLIVAAAVAVWQLWLLAIALVGLFLRPRRLAAVLPGAVNAALAGAVLLLGALLIGGFDPLRGLSLGLAAFAAQWVVAGWLTRGLPVLDRAQLRLAQQNGITAIVLALKLEPTFRGVVAVVAPAIVVTNVTHLIANQRRAVKAE
ncbi:MAG: hypothetical protein HOU81_14810 [Hamadaea sp.]|uniref:hypothetical protein n=1 Tax=Hamadaea sp. TaxID=2024425 RepID=UPI00181D8FF0|nr:hypothetical protein [Hamadaea sp.]NUR72084.1 hypothetical protein [Hamadaea sp.]NUT21886.1 hypothetical protein [Hamadaea sp.]